MPATQWPYQTVETRDFLRRLSPYLPEQIDVFQPTTERYGQLRGLPFTQVGEKAIADVAWYITDEAQAAATVSDDVAGNLLPVLYAFEDLGKQASSFRTNAAAHAAMMQLATAMHGGPVTEIVEALYSEGNGRSRIWLEYENEDEDYCNAYLWDDGSAQDANEEAVQMIDYLRHNHFAVGLQPHQYHRRIVGFDYTTGLRPPKQE